MRYLTKSLVAIGLIILGCSSAFAQGSIAGAVKDASGGVLPGVMVVAGSPALIEKTRLVVTDSSGEYKIVDLRPGTYDVTFTLNGFTTLRREGIEITGTLTATVDATLPPASQQQEITVSESSPVVDVQGTTEERVLEGPAVDALPASRNIVGIVPTTVGVANSGGNVVGDVGGSQGSPPGGLTAHDSRSGDGQTLVDGVAYTSSPNGSSSLTPYNMGAYQEVVVDSSALSADLPEGGVRVNLLPREGGNKFSGTVFAALATNGMQSNNLTQRLMNRGLTSVDSVKTIWDINPSLGGPIIRDKLWFYATFRNWGSNLYAGGVYEDLNQNNPNAHTYAPNLSQPGKNDQKWTDAQVRLTWQATPRNKFGLSWDEDYYCRCPYSAGTQDISIGTAVPTYKSPEAADYYHGPENRTVEVSWTSLVTTRLLLQATFLIATQDYLDLPPPDVLPGTIPIVDQSNNNFQYRANAGNPTSAGTGGEAGILYLHTKSYNYYYRAAASYVTGAHAFQFGANDSQADQDAHTLDNGTPLVYRVTTVAIPNQITVRDTPYEIHTHVRHNFGLYAQDRWKIHRLTLTGGLRFDYLLTSDPDVYLGPTALFPNQNVTLGNPKDSDWKDISYRSGAAYDLFGNGKTALRVSMSKYLQEPVLGIRDPLSSYVFFTTRSWNDTNGNWIPDCNLTLAAANGECGALASSAFGNLTTNPTTFDPKLYSGFDHRPDDFEFSAGIQHQLFSQTAINFGYYRRWYGNFQVTANLDTNSPADWTPYSITAPADPRLPGGGGYAISGLYDLNPAFVGKTLNYSTLSSTYGDQYEHFNGFDFSVNTKTKRGLLIQGGFSTGEVITDDCAIVPALGNPSPLYCHQNSGFLTQVKVVVAYPIRKVGINISAVFQSNPGYPLAASDVVPNSVIAPVLGRSLSGGAANATINLIAPGSAYTERLNQLDLRVSKVIKFRERYTAAFNIDGYNMFNSDTILVENNTYGAAWQNAEKSVLGRFGKVSIQLGF